MREPINVFYSYAQEDSHLQKRLDSHLATGWQVGIASAATQLEISSFQVIAL
jgi:hypothetical protein